MGTGNRVRERIHCILTVLNITRNLYARIERPYAQNCAPLRANARPGARIARPTRELRALAREWRALARELRALCAPLRGTKTLDPTSSPHGEGAPDGWVGWYSGLPICARSLILLSPANFIGSPPYMNGTLSLAERALFRLSDFRASYQKVFEGQEI